MQTAMKMKIQKNSFRLGVYVNQFWLDSLLCVQLFIVFARAIDIFKMYAK